MFIIVFSSSLFSKSALGYDGWPGALLDIRKIRSSYNVSMTPWRGFLIRWFKLINIWCKLNILDSNQNGRFRSKCCRGEHCSSVENRRFSDFSLENDGVFALRQQILLRQNLRTTNGRPYTVDYASASAFWASSPEFLTNTKYLRE